jgi:hypothetical protein
VKAACAGMHETCGASVFSELSRFACSRSLYKKMSKDCSKLGTVAGFLKKGLKPKTGGRAAGKTQKARWHRKNHLLVLPRKVWNFVGAFRPDFLRLRHGRMKN